LMSPVSIRPIPVTTTLPDFSVLSSMATMILGNYIF
jgi:hypothetical protein